MTKRYARLNWQNTPSVATPLNATNLNKMDKGIDDLDLYKIDVDAIVNNGVTTTTGTVLDGRMGKTLQDQVATLNNNLANLGKLASYKKVGNQSIPTDTNTQVTFQAKESSSEGSFSKIDTSTGRIKILETGIYDIQVQYTYASNEAGLRNFIIENFTTTLSAGALNAGASSQYFFHRAFTRANAGVLLNIATLQNSGVSIDLLQNYTRVVIMQVAKL